MQKNMTEGNLVKILVLFTVPLILSGLFQQLFNWVDAFIVGNVEGELSLAAIGATTAIYNLFIMVITGFTSGLSILTAQQVGLGAEERVKENLSSFAIVLGGAFFAISLFGVTFTGFIIDLLDTPVNLAFISGQYLRIMFVGIPFLAVYNVYTAVLRGIGDSRAPFFSILVSSAVNVLLDILFVAVFRYGAAGAAAATVISQSAMTVYVVLYTIKKHPYLRFRINRAMVKRSILAKGAAFGAPPAVQSGTTSVGNIILQRFMNGFGEQTVAAITTAYRIDTVILLPIINLGSGIATVVAQNIGAGSGMRAKKTFQIGMALMAGVSLCLTLVVVLSGQYLLALFGLTTQSVAIGTSFFYAIARCYLIFGLAMAVRGYLEGCGDMLFSSLAGIAALMTRIAASYLFADRCGNMVVAYAEAFSWFVLLTVYIIRLNWITKKEKAEDNK